MTEAIYPSWNGFWMRGVTLDDGTHLTSYVLDDDGNPKEATLEDIEKFQAEEAE